MPRSSGKTYSVRPEIEISSVDSAQPSRLLPEDGDRIQSPKRCL
jgi:hypothetical protein